MTRDPATGAPFATGFASVRGLQLYYERYGHGAPLVLLHGGVVGIEMFRPILPLLASTRQVVALELQGHGRTADIDRPFGYEALADDVQAAMQYLGLAQADVLGLSLGGGVALQLAFRHPTLVRRLVVVSAPFARRGWYPEVLADFDRMGPEAAAPLAQSPLAQQFPQVDWGSLFSKIGALQRQDYDWSPQVAQLRAPVLLVFADADAIRLTHVVEFYGLLGGGQRDAGVDGAARPVAQLAILPGCTHYSISGSPALAAVVAPFLEASLPLTPT